MLEHGGPQGSVVRLIDVADPVGVAESVLGFTVLVWISPGGHHAEGGRVPLGARPMDALVGVHERHASPVKLEPLVERALVWQFVPELCTKCIQSEETRGAQELVSIHAAIVLRRIHADNGVPGTGYPGR